MNQDTKESVFDSVEKYLIPAEVVGLLQTIDVDYVESVPEKNARPRYSRALSMVVNPHGRRVGFLVTDWTPSPKPNQNDIGKSWFVETHGSACRLLNAPFE
jgi:hypothetical protein